VCRLVRWGCPKNRKYLLHDGLKAWGKHYGEEKIWGVVFFNKARVSASAVNSCSVSTGHAAAGGTLSAGDALAEALIAAAPQLPSTFTTSCAAAMYLSATSALLSMPANSPMLK
jgi:hypothetical protein